MILVETKSTAIFRTLNVFQLFSAIGLIGLLISPLFFPQILYGMPRVPVPAVHSQVEKAAKEPESLIGNKAPVSFEADYINRLGALTDGCMSDYKPYLQQEFNLTQLSVMINIPVHHLAWYFREIKNRSFTDFRNEWRIQHAKGLIRQGKTAEMTLEAIGMLSGFFSRNTFITAFKKFEGITPSEYVAKLTRLAPKGST
jgi:AraC-like DNA-binding protein